MAWILKWQIKHLTNNNKKKILQIVHSNIVKSFNQFIIHFDAWTSFSFKLITEIIAVLTDNRETIDLIDIR